MKNLNLFFNKTYFESLGTGGYELSLKTNNREIESTTFDREKDYKPFEISRHTFLLEVCAPGLLVGLGYSHSVGQLGKDNTDSRVKTDSEVGVGFSFDYVTGQPYIPGSTVKGILRSVFINTPQLITSMTGLDEHGVKALEEEIFDYKDAFFDAVVYDGNEYRELVGFDYITPHKSPTDDPVPIKILRIVPGVRLEFRFALLGTEEDVEKKLSLFKNLLIFLGAGAKTNVGYGVLKDTDGGARPYRTRVREPIPNNAGNGQYAGRTNGGPFNRNANREVTCVNCTRCGTRNYKYPQGSNVPYRNWPNCRNCRSRLI